MVAPAGADRVGQQISSGSRFSVRSIALAGIAVEMVVLIALTLWLYPNIWAVANAVFDSDQSAGPDVGVNLTEVANHPEVMEGETVTISAEVDDLLGPRAMIIGNDTWLVGDEVLVIAAADLGTLVAPPNQTSISKGDVVQVTGVVRLLDRSAPLAELGDRLDAAVLDDYDGTSVLVAKAIAPNSPQGRGVGDKEFDIGSSGYEIGITVYDVTHRTDEYLGTVVTVSGEVEEHLLTPHAFLLDDDALLVVSATPHPELFVEATAYVTGEVRRFELKAIEAEIGVDLDDERLAPFEGEPVVVAQSVGLVT
ncbi:MAG: hypothetical protein M3Q03_12280 [Chloroflexota bacterium]|nr:hypothetical protein [Chloroflexota bacterium]